jgi:hypothetical protein
VLLLLPVWRLPVPKHDERRTLRPSQRMLGLVLREHAARHSRRSARVIVKESALPFIPGEGEGVVLTKIAKGFGVAQTALSNAPRAVPTCVDREASCEPGESTTPQCKGFCSLKNLLFVSLLVAERRLFASQVTPVRCGCIRTTTSTATDASGASARCVSDFMLGAGKLGAAYLHSFAGPDPCPRMRVIPPRLQRHRYPDFGFLPAPHKV